MTDRDKADFREVRPIVVGIVALAFKLRQIGAPDASVFDAADAFVKEFEKRL